MRSTTTLVYDILYRIGNPNIKCTINTLADWEKCPPGVIRALFDAVFCPPIENYFQLSIFYNNVPVIWDEFRKKIISNELNKQFDNGDYDDLFLSLNSSAQNNGKILLTQETFEKWNKILGKSKQTKPTKEKFVFASNRTYISDDNLNNQLVEKIYSLLEDERKIECVGPKGERFYPFGVFFYSYTGEYYAIVHLNDTDIRFIPFSQIDINLGSFGVPIKQDLLNNEKEKVKDIRNYLWAPDDLNWGDQPVQIKMLVLHENVKKKILFDLSRFKYTKTDNPDGTTQLDFFMYNTSSFQSWLLSYGSSIVILEPIEIRRYIVNEYNTIKNSLLPNEVKAFLKDTNS